VKARAPDGKPPAGRLESWRDLFDVGTLDHAIYLVEQEFEMLRCGGSSDLEAALRRHVVVPLALYIEQHYVEGRHQVSVDAAHQFLRCVETLAMRLNSQSPPVAGEAGATVAELRAAWQDFRAEHASVHIYHHEPARSRKAHESGKQGLQTFLHKVTGEPLTPELLRTLLRDWKSTAQKQTAFWNHIETEFGPSESTQRRMLR